jgi:hypothetical protein
MNNNKLNEKQLIFIFKKKTDDKIKELEKRIEQLEKILNISFPKVESNKQFHNIEIDMVQETKE